MIADLMGRLRAGKITTGNLHGQQRSAFRRAGRSRSALVRVFREIGEKGSAHVDAELERQDAT